MAMQRSLQQQSISFEMKRTSTPFPVPLPLTVCNLPWWVVFTKIACWMQWTLKRVSTNRDRIFFCKQLAWVTFSSQLQIEITMSASTKRDSDILYIISYFSQLPIQIKQDNETLLTLWTQIPAAVVQLSASHISRGKHTLMYRKIRKKAFVWQNTLLCKISKKNILDCNFLKPPRKLSLRSLYGQTQSPLAELKTNLRILSSTPVPPLALFLCPNQVISWTLLWWQHML